VELIPGIEPGRRPYQGRRLPLHQISAGANGGIRTRTSRLGRPAGSRYPTFALVRPTGIEPVPPRWQRGMLPPHPGRTSDRYRSPARRHPSVVKDPALASWWAARDSNPNAPAEGERRYRPPADHPHVPPMATAPGFEPGPSSFGGSDASVTPRCRCHFTSRPFRRQNLPASWRGLPPSARPKQKRPSRGSP
jgi:hypothetical protein